jgi:stearoyl-CoA desaturase (delta-9 desaturase)
MFKISRLQAYLSLLVLNHILFAGGIYYVVSTHEYYWLGISLVWFCLVRIIGVNAGLHRYFSHRSYKTTKFWERVITFFVINACYSTPIVYSAKHRDHHSSGYELYEGKTYLDFTPASKEQMTKWVRDLLQNRDLVFVQKYYIHIMVAYMILLALFNPLLTIFIFSIPACLCINPFAGGALHFFGHNRYGYQNFPREDGSKNNTLCNILTVGEGLHNNHHNNPNHWNFKAKWWEIDPPGIFIRLIKK